MSKKATEFQKREMSKMYRGKQIIKPLNTGWVDERVACVQEWVATIPFYRKGTTNIKIGNRRSLHGHCHSDSTDFTISHITEWILRIPVHHFFCSGHTFIHRTTLCIRYIRITRKRSTFNWHV